MASLLTGVHPARHRVEQRSARLGDDPPTLPGRLAGAGYTSALVTANPQTGSFFGFARGFDRTIELYGRRSAGPVSGRELVARGDEVAERAIDWLDGAGRPFLLVVLAVDPHAPYSPPPRFRPDEPAPPRARYQGEVSAADAAFGAVVERLRESGELEQTFVAFTADHGEEFGEQGRTGHGASLADEAIHVPLILRLAEPRALRGVRRMEPVQLVDVLPTLLEAAGIEPAADTDGRPLLGRVGAPRPVLASVVTPRGRLRAARSFPWKLVSGPKPGDRALYDLRRGERIPVDVQLEPGAADAAHLLARALDDLEPDGEPVSEAGSPPAELRAALEQLGYLSR